MSNIIEEINRNIREEFNLDDFDRNSCGDPQCDDFHCPRDTPIYEEKEIEDFVVNKVNEAIRRVLEEVAIEHIDCNDKEKIVICTKGGVSPEELLKELDERDE